MVPFLCPAVPSLCPVPSYQLPKYGQLDCTGASDRQHYLPVPGGIIPRMAVPGGIIGGIIPGPRIAVPGGIAGIAIPGARMAVPGGIMATH